MKLYFSPGACSLAVHIALREAGLPFDLEQVDLKEKKTKSGADYWAVNGKGSVPALALDDGKVMTEVAVLLQYVADAAAAKKLAPAVGTPERLKLLEWLNYVATEIHKGVSPLFNPKAPEEWREVVRGLVTARFNFLDKNLAGKTYLLGNAYSVADGYLFTILRWAIFHKFDLATWPNLKSFFDRLAARPAVQAALKAEGLG
jgi:glutathione S-transferase